MESLLSQETQDPINIYFVLPKNTTETTCSEKLASAYQACVDVGFPSRWVKEQDVLQMQPAKQDVFICDPFEGAAFDHVSSAKFKCVRVLGPPCLQACLSRSEPVPELPYPLYTAAMRGMVVTSTGFQKPEKLRLQKLVRQMSGIFSNDFHEGVTHLVAAIVASQKYQVALSREVPVMRAGWVERVWELSCHQHVQATDPQFADLTCPPMQGLYICVSQLSRKDKEVIRKTIENNGGKYMAQLECEKTNVLISPNMDGEKVSFARRWQIPCVVAAWLYDSIEQGSCLPMEQYSTATRAKLSSTPTKDHTVAAHGGLADLTMSTIHGANESRVVPVDETIMNATTANGADHTALPPQNPGHEELVELDRLDVLEVTKAGQFLDGCKIHLVGFDSRRDDKLLRLLNAAGAMRFSQLLPSVTHVVVNGEAPVAAVTAAWRPHLVGLGWLLACCRAGRPLPEAEYLCCRASEPPPPETEQETVLPAPVSDAADSAAEQASSLADQTSLAGGRTLFGGALLPEPSPPRTREPAARRSRKQPPGLSFFLRPELDSAALKEARRILHQHGGLRAASAEEAHFCLVPVGYELQPGDVLDRLVTMDYIHHCVELDQVIEPEYYHRPIGPVRPDILSDCVIGISSYSGRERQFLALLAESMGAEFQEVFARRDNPTKGARASTHLVCQAAEGHKYAAACKWGVPSVSREWLRACAANGRRLDTGLYAVDAASTTTITSITTAAAETTLGSAAVGAIPGVAAAAVSSAGAVLVPPPPAGAVCSSAAVSSAAVSSAATSVAASAACGVAQQPVTPGGADKLPWYMVPPVDLTPVQPPRMFAAESAQRAAAALADMPTPQTPYGAMFAGPNPSASTRKAWKRWLDAMEDTPENKRRRASTPMSALVMRFFDNLPKADPRFTGELDSSSQQIPDIDSKAVNEELQSAADSPSARRPVALSDQQSTPAPRAGDATAATAEPVAEEGQSPQAPAPQPELTTADSDVSRQLAELNQLVTRRSSTPAAAAAGSRRIPDLEAAAPHTETESGPQAAEVSQSQCAAITWDDPRERQARNNLMSEQQVTGQDLENVPPNCPPAADPAQKPASRQPPCVVFSGMETTDRERYQVMVERLGGTVLDSATLEPQCSHVVTTRPNRSEKHLAAVASGRWLLQPAYLDACEAAGHFLPEERYEWGNPECLESASMSKNSVEYKLSTAAYRWRQKITGEGIPGAFHEVVAVMLTSPERSRAFERLLVSGGGRVVDVAELCQQPVTHVIVEPARADRKLLTAQLWRQLVSRQLPCVPPVFLNECLTALTPPSPGDWLVDEYKRLMVKQT